MEKKIHFVAGSFNCLYILETQKSDERIHHQWQIDMEIASEYFAGCYVHD